MILLLQNQSQEGMFQPLQDALSLFLSYWNYPKVADRFRLRHRNLLHCSLLIVRGAQVTQR